MHDTQPDTHQNHQPPPDHQQEHTRVTSSIPRTDSPTPWLYPSESQLHAAITRKGFPVPFDHTKYILLMHNLVNEQCWQHICRYERVASDTTGTELSLKRFQGRPGQWTPRSWFKANILGHVAPFDRHDWIVQRADGSECRYVIDFYNGRPSVEEQVAVYLDVRPAIDNVAGLLLRLRHFYRSNIKDRWV
jgi:cytochrome c heme-lyase